MQLLRKGAPEETNDQYSGYFTVLEQAILYHPAAELTSLSDPAMRRDVRSGINARPVLYK